MVGRGLLVHRDHLLHIVIFLVRLFTLKGKQCLPFKVVLAHAERTHWSHNTVVVCTCRAACLLCVCACSALGVFPLYAWVHVGVPSYFVVLLYEPCAVLFKENYIVLFMKGDSINRGALMLGAASLERSTSWTCVLPVQSSLVTLI